jgi:hypothetical protein
MHDLTIARMAAEAALAPQAQLAIGGDGRLFRDPSGDGSAQHA